MKEIKLHREYIEELLKNKKITQYIFYDYYSNKVIGETSPIGTDNIKIGDSVLILNDRSNTVMSNMQTKKYNIYTVEDTKIDNMYTGERKIKINKRWLWEDTILKFIKEGDA